MSSLQTLASYPGLLQSLRILIVTSSIFLGGLSFCLSTWVIPNMYLVSPVSQLHQFAATFTRGGKFLFPAGRAIMAALVTNAVLTAYHPDPKISTTWTTWAALVALLIPVAPYEIIFIFPINDRAEELKKQVDTDKKPLTPKQETEIRGLLEQWAARNYGRAALPFITGLVALCNL